MRYALSAVLCVRSSSLPFFLLLPRPPRSPLFPYTTLFRSRCTASCTTRSTSTAPYSRATTPRARTRSPSNPDAVRRGAKDRKSTRLNSSHLGISYAVFCLKKKKQNGTQHAREQQE